MDPSVQYDGLPELKPRKDKLLSAMLYILEQAANRGRSLSKGEIVKTLFFADDAHLAEFGRPITFDNYVEMKKGPVGNLASDMLNEKVQWTEFGLPEAPWRISSPRGLAFYSPSGQRATAGSSPEATQKTWTQRWHRSWKQVSREHRMFSHEHPAWAAAWGLVTGKRQPWTGVRFLPWTRLRHPIWSWHRGIRSDLQVVAYSVRDSSRSIGYRLTTSLRAPLQRSPVRPIVT